MGHLDRAPTRKSFGYTEGNGVIVTTGAAAPNPA